MRHTVLTASILLLATAAQANLLHNGSFEEVSAAAAPYYVRSNVSTPGWTQFGDGVDLIHNSYAQGPAVLVNASDGVQFLDMNQAGLLGGIWQTVAATAGTTYRLTLDSAAWATNARGGTIGYALFDPTSSQTLASGSFTDPTGGTWVTLGVDAAAIGATIGVRIEGLAAAQAGMGLDNVALVAVVPEPGTSLMLLAGLGVLAGAARRSRSVARRP